MNKYTLLLLAILIAFLSCDGRDRVHKTNKEVLVENKLLDSFSENIKYFPETYAETVTDTILSNGFRVKIKTFTDLKSSIKQIKTQDSIEYTEFYRDIISEITISKNEKVIFKERFNKKLFLNDNSGLKNFFQLAVIESVYMSDTAPVENNEVILFVSFIIPNKQDFMMLKISIDETGYYKIKEIEEEYEN